MKIYTYSDPFKLKEEEYWEEISSVPNLCVSQTLVQGLTTPGKNKYQREDYGFIYTIKDFNESLYKEWFKNPENDIEQFLDLSKKIAKIKDENLRNTFKFNQRDVYNAIRLLIELNIKPEEIKKGYSLEIDEFINIYEKLYITRSWSVLNNLKIDKKKIKDSFIELLDNEIDKMGETVNGKDTANYLRHYKNNIGTINKIVIHGVHRFESMIIRLINDLDSLGIEVVFLINYIPEFERVYETWRRVYLWTGTELIHSKNHYTNNKENLGEAIGFLLEGEFIDYSADNIECIKFYNPTSFSDYVSNIYAETINEEKEFNKSHRINKMREQFYAVDNKLVNDILKQYYPEQFGNRHFLAYPIGQFILNLYNMWDDEKKEMQIDNSMFKDCLSTGFFQQEEKPNPVETYRKIEAYCEYFRINGEYTLDKLIEKVDQLINNIKVIENGERKKNSKSLLRRFSTYNMDIEELECFQEVLKSMNVIVEELFKENGHELNFKEHFKKLLDILVEQGINKPYISQEEKDMFFEIKGRLESIENTDLTGSIDDIKESLHFYLNRIDEESNESNWIVRNFEQLDGGVLLGRNTKTDRTYHLALVGDQDMNKGIKEFLPWPLDEKFFIENNFKSKDFNIFFDSYKEYRNFLRYSLFYSTYYLNNKINISYIENNEEQENSLYFVLDMLGFSPIEFDDDRYLIYESNKQFKDLFKTIPQIRIKSLTDDEARNFLFCEYRYVIEELLDRGTNYESEYLQKLYYITMLHVFSWEKIECEGVDEIESDEIKNKVDALHDGLKRYLIWNDIDSIDIKRKVVKRLENKSVDSLMDEFKKIKDNKKYIAILKKFIYAKISEGYDEEMPNLIEDLHSDWKLDTCIDRVYTTINNGEDLSKPDNVEVCEYCGQSDLCLYRFKED